MGAFNKVRGRASCPRCHNSVEVVGQFKFGNVRQLDYQVGDTLRWGGNDLGHPGLRHVVVDVVADGPCARCGFSEEWDLYLHVRHGVLERIETATGQHDFMREGKTYIVLDE